MSTILSPSERPDLPEPSRGRTVFTRRTASLMGVQVLATGSFVPDQVVTNGDLQSRLGFDPAWIEQRTGILERRHAPPEMSTSDLCVEAAERCIRRARIDPQQIDLLIVGTFTPDFQCPATACLVQDRLGLDCPAFDAAAACAGFMYALVTAAQYIATGNARLALVIGADTNSRIVNPTDQRTYPLFGDGAGAVLLARGDMQQGLMCYQMGSDGSGAALLDRPAGGVKHPVTAEDLVTNAHLLKMDGRAVFKWAVRLVTDTIELLLQKTCLNPNDVSLYLLHQANIRIISAAMDYLGIPEHKVFNNLHKYGNTSGGSIPLVLDEAVQAGRLSRGDLVVMCGFGAGLTWGTSLMRW